MISAKDARQITDAWLGPTTVRGLDALIRRVSRTGLHNVILDFLAEEWDNMNKLILAASKAGYRTYRDDLPSGIYRLYIEW